MAIFNSYVELPEGNRTKQLYFCDVLEIWMGDINGPSLPSPQSVMSIREIICRTDNSQGIPGAFYLFSNIFWWYRIFGLDQSITSF